MTDSAERRSQSGLIPPETTEQAERIRLARTVVTQASYALTNPLASERHFRERVADNLERAAKLLRGAQ